jgi:chorismate mutase
VSDPRLEALRKQITQANRRLLDDVNERLRLVDEARTLKRALGATLHDPAREAQMMQELLDANTGPLSPEQLREVFKAIFAVSLEYIERK